MNRRSSQKPEADEAWSVRNSLAKLDQAIDDVEKYFQPDGASNASTITNLTKNLTGSTVLVLPIAIAQGGVTGAVMLLAMYCLVFGFTFWLLGECCEQTGVYSYRDLWRVSLGKRSAWIVDLCQGCYGAISSIGYVVCIGDYTMEGVRLVDPTNWFAQPDNKIWIIVGASIFPLWPLCLLKNLSMLKYTSIAGVFIVAGVFVYTYFCFVWHLTDDGIYSVEGGKYDGIPHNNCLKNLDDGMFKFDSEFFSAIGHAAAAYGVHMNAARFYKELKVRTSENYRKVTFSAFVGSFFFKTPFAIAGFALFGLPTATYVGTQANSLRNFAIWPGVSIMMLWVSMGMSLMFTFPLMFSAAREALFGVIKAAGLEDKGLKNEGPSRIIITTLLLCLVSTVAATFGNLDFLSRIKGHLLANCICLLFPALIYLNLGSQEEEMPLNFRGRVQLKQWCTTGSKMILAVSGLMFPLGIYNVVVKPLMSLLA